MVKEGGRERKEEWRREEEAGERRMQCREERVRV